MLFAKKAEDLTWQDIEDCLAESIPEDQNLDYKLALPEKGKNRDLLTDIAAFANGGGGVVLFGVEEDSDEAGKPNGKPTSIPGVTVSNLDELQRRWYQVIETGLDPRLIPRPTIVKIDGPDGRSVVAIRVPRGLAAPHMVRETWRFPARHGARNANLDTSELRMAFQRSGDWARRVRTFRNERLGQLLARDTAVSLVDEPLLVIHLVPFSVLDPGQGVDLHAIKARGPQPVEDFHSFGTRFNVDGLALGVDAGQNGADSAVQFFRDGCIEVATGIARRDVLPPLTVLEDLALSAIAAYAPLISHAGATYPLSVVLSLAGVRGRSAVSAQRFRDPLGPINRDVLSAVDIALDDERENVASSMRPAFDSIWQAFGVDRSPSYGPDGKWTREQR